jgi:sulfatase maturation enzyme AslB (radical SAM superfamily)
MKLDFNWDETKNTLDNFAKISDKFVLEFLGGEPLLNFPLIKKSIEYMESRDDVKVDKYILTTNATLMSDEILAFIDKYKHKLAVAVSIDGTKEMNALRTFKGDVSTHDVVMKNLKKLQQLDLKENLVAHLVLHYVNMGSFVEGVEYLYNNGMRQIEFGISSSEHTPLTDDLKEKAKEQSKLFAENYKKGLYPDLTFRNFHDPDGYRYHQKLFIVNENNEVVAESLNNTINTDNVKIHKEHREEAIKEEEANKEKIPLDYQIAHLMIDTYLETVK